MAKSHFNNVKKVRRNDATGLPYYYYHQFTGARLPDVYGSPEFAAEWAKQELAASKPVAKSHTDPGTYWSLCEAFMAPDSDAWNKIGEHTRADYKKCRDWMSKHGADDKQAADLTQERCEGSVSV